MALPSDAATRERVHAILSTPEFRPAVDPAWWTALEHAWQRFGRWLDRLGSLAKWAILLSALVLLGGVVAYVVATFHRLLREAPSARAGTAARDPPGLARSLLAPTCEGLLSQARRLKLEGRLREAARTLQQARLVLECRRRAVAWRTTLADWEWIEALGSAPGLVEFTRHTQRLAFGAAEPAVPALDACEGRLVAELEERAS